MADDLTAALDEIRERAAAFSESGGGVAASITAPKSARSVPRLLALADALLELCTDWDGRAREIMSQVTGEDLIDGAAGFKAISATGYEGRAKEVRELISRALLGEESSDG